MPSITITKPSGGGGQNPFDQNLNTTDNVSFNNVNVSGSGSNDSTLRVGTLEFQPYSTNNAWFGDNAYYNGGFYRRNFGYAGLFYFQGQEGQFRFADISDGGTSFSPQIQMKIGLGGKFGVGQNIDYNSGSYSGAQFYIDNGNVGINTTSPSEKLEVNGKIKTNSLRISTSSTPASSSAAGSTGDIKWDSSYIYVCTATNTWKRAALSTW